MLYMCIYRFIVVMTYFRIIFSLQPLAYSNHSRVFLFDIIKNSSCLLPIKHIKHSRKLGYISNKKYLYFMFDFTLQLRLLLQVKSVINLPNFSSIRHRRNLPMPLQLSFSNNSTTDSDIGTGSILSLMPRARKCPSYALEPGPIFQHWEQASGITITRAISCDYCLPVYVTLKPIKHSMIYDNRLVCIAA